MEKRSHGSNNKEVKREIQESYSAHYNTWKGTRLSKHDNRVYKKGIVKTSKYYYINKMPSEV